jgi:hypothetical protein
MIEMLFFVFGVYSFVFGKVSLPWNISLTGWRARVSGIFLMAPLPVVLLLSPHIGLGLSPEKGQSILGLLELTTVALGVGGAVIFALLTRSRDRST